MKKITICLITDENALLQDKNQIGNFIRNLNDKYEKFNVYFKLISSEDIKEIRDEDIEKSELVFIIFKEKSTKEVENKFDIAYTSFQNIQKPKIATYIKKTDKVNDSLVEFMKRLDQEIGHYYNTYENIDTIKLNIILQLDALGLEKAKVQNGKIYIGDEEIMTLENIPMIFNNNDLNELKKEYKELEDKYWELKEQIRKNPDDEECFEKFSEIKEKRDKIKNAIFNLEEEILELESFFVEISSEGKVSKRQICAKKYIDQGNIKEAKNILDFNEIKKDGDRLISIQNKIKKEIRIIVNELIQRAEVLKIDIKNNNRFTEIEKSYEEAIRIEKQGGLARTTLSKYAVYLERQKKFDKEIEIIEEYLNYLMMNKLEIDPKTYTLLANVYFEKKRYAEAEDCYLKSIELLKVLANEEPELFERRLAVSYGNLGLLYRQLKKFEKAIEYFEKDLEIVKKVSNENFGLYGADLSIAYGNIAALYNDMEKYDKAEENYLRAIEIAKKLDLSKIRNKEILEILYDNLGLFYKKIENYDQAEKYFLQAIEITKNIAKENREAYEDDLKISYNNVESIFDIYSDIADNNFLKSNYEEAEKYYLKCINIQENYLDDNVRYYKANLATSYYNIALVYSKLSKYEESKSFLVKCIKIREELAIKNPEKYQAKLERANNNLEKIIAKMQK